MAVRSMSTVAASQVRAPKYLVIDGYSEEGRKDLTSFGASTAGTVFKDLLLLMLFCDFSCLSPTVLSATVVVQSACIVSSTFRNSHFCESRVFSCVLAGF